MHRYVAPLSFLLGAAAVPVAAQSASQVVIGSLTRLSIACPTQARARCGKLVGTVEVLEADSLTLLIAEDQRRRVAWADVQELAVSRRSRGHADVGFLAGTAVGVLTGALWKSSCEKDAGEYAGLCGLSYVITVPSGILVGTVSGALVRTPVWEVVALALPRGGSAMRGSMRLALVLRL